MLSRIFNAHRVKEFLFPVRVLMGLLSLQFLLGPGAAALKILTIEDYNMPPIERVVVATVHLATGALILALCVTVALRARRFTVSVPNAKSATSSSQNFVGVAA